MSPVTASPLLECAFAARVSLVLLLTALACGSTSGLRDAGHLPGSPEAADRFSQSRAWTQLERLVRIGERVSGTRGARRTRRFLRDELETAGVTAQEFVHEVEWEGETREFTNIVGTIAGSSRDTILLMANADTHELPGLRFKGANEGASGVAVLLELARVLARQPHSYTISLVFLDGDALDAGHTSRGAGTSALVARLAEEGALASIRMAVFFDRVGDSDLVIARDLASHRGYRELFFEAAARLGHGDAFPADAGFSSPSGSHLGLAEAGVRPVVAIVDDGFGGEPRPGPFTHSEQDDLAHCSPVSLGIVGAVAQTAIAELETRLAAIDRFAAAPGQSDADWGSLLPSESLEGSAEALSEEAAAPPVEPAPVEADSPESAPAAAPGS